VNRAKNKTDQSPGNRSLKLFFSIKHDVHAAKLESISTTHFSHRYPHGSFKAMKKTMKAVALTRYLPISDPESLQDFELPRPVPGKRDLLVRIGAVSVNPVDVKVRAPKPGTEAEPKILGWDAAGVVERIGSDADIGSQGALLNEVATLIDNKLIRTTLTEVVPKINAKNLRDVHRRIESGRTLGKIVLAGWS
jgi:NADPH:quinone reductase-like Zn-dependent oxidoreductase